MFFAHDKTPFVWLRDWFSIFAWFLENSSALPATFGKHGAAVLTDFILKGGSFVLIWKTSLKKDPGGGLGLGFGFA
ncbi:hypothetical protein A3B57_02540 [Microgenomates group bacterium RIFCSPLOWO2_01_FULL_47_10]|nr:MAG: hypothetical protein A3B57_02540 [Microgenomates group bacterium RIFCSPLOWO2_01_FULL_47_10]